MLISAVLPIMSLYGQYAHSGHVINLPKYVESFDYHDYPVSWISSSSEIPSLHSCRESCRALQWLVANNKYYSSIRINADALAMLPIDGDLSGLHSVTIDCANEDTSLVSALDEDPYTTHLSGSFVPSTTQRMTGQ